MKSDMSAKCWDSSTKQGRVRMMLTLYNTYSIKGVEDFDVAKLNDELSEDICLLLPRIAAALDKALRKGESFCPHVMSMCTLLSTQVGQDFAMTSAIVLPEWMKCLSYEDNSRPTDFATLLKMLRKLCAFSEALRTVVFRLGALEKTTVILQRYYQSEEVHAAGISLILDLASVDANSSVFSSMLRLLFNSPHLLCKLSSIRLMNSSLVTKSIAVINMDGWEDEAFKHLTRVLLCAPLTHQYDSAELLALMFHMESMQSRAMVLCAAVLCLRYTVGGHTIVSPPPNWPLKYSGAEGAEAVTEVPELLVCNVISAALSHIDEVDSLSLNVRKKAISKYEYLTSLMRKNKLHRSLLAHVLWYVREKTVLHKVISLWNTGGIEQPPTPDELQDMSRFPQLKELGIRKLSKLGVMARKWKNRRSTVQKRSVSTPPELHRASAMLKSNIAEDEKETTAQDVCCIGCMRVLQKWVNSDPEAHKDIVGDFIKFGYEPQIVYISTLLADGIIDILHTISNVIWIINSQGRAAEVMGKKSFLSTYLSSVLSPGELVKDLKLALGDAKASDMSTIAPIDPASYESSDSTMFGSDKRDEGSHIYGGVEGTASSTSEGTEEYYEKVLRSVRHLPAVSGNIEEGPMSPTPPPMPPPGGRKAPRGAPSRSSYLREVLAPSSPVVSSMGSYASGRAATSINASVDTDETVPETSRVQINHRVLSERYVLRDGACPKQGLLAGHTISIVTPRDKHTPSPVQASPLKGSSSATSPRRIPRRTVKTQQSNEAHATGSLSSSLPIKGSTIPWRFSDTPMTDDDSHLEDLEESVFSAHSTIEDSPLASIASAVLRECYDINADVVLGSYDDKPMTAEDPAFLVNPRTPLTAPTMGDIDTTPLDVSDRPFASVRVEDEDYMPGGLYEGFSREKLNPQPILESVALSVAQELAELQDLEKKQSVGDRAMRTVCEEDEEDECGLDEDGMDGSDDDDDEESRKIRHIHMVVNQLIEEESSILTELSSRADFTAFNNLKNVPSRDPLLPAAESKSATSRRQGLPSPSRPQSGPRHTVTSIVSQQSYKAVVSQQRQKDVNTLQDLAGRDSILLKSNGLLQGSTASEVSRYVDETSQV